MDDIQFSALKAWLVDNKKAELPKFVLTPSAILPRRLSVAQDPACALHSDAWEGYPHSQHELLKFICDREVKGLVFLSGDDHICHFTKATVSNEEGNETTFYSIHSSGLYAPYPFANASPNDFVSPDKFAFPDPISGPYCCKVETEFSDDRDGFTLVTARPKAPHWDLEVRFHSAEGEKPDQPSAVELPS
jgi:hypothetical protein